jgi:hypothetical protein
MKTPQGDKIYDVLRLHQGRENAISAPEICRALRWPEGRERQVRQIIRDESPLWAEDAGIVCAAPGGGYFLATSMEELLAYESWLLEGRNSYDERLHRVRAYCRKRGFDLEQFRRAA